MAKEINKEQEAVMSAVSKTEEFFNKYSKALWISLAVLVILCGAGYLTYRYAYLPKKAEALGQMYKAEANFRAGNYELALNGDGNDLGFIQLIDEYGKKVGKDAYLYAAICQMELGDAESALKYVSKYSTNDPIMKGRALAVKGDAYVNLDENAKAVKCYENAASASDNNFSAAYLLKAGIIYEAMGEDAKALAAYKEIKEKYPRSFEAYEIDKYIARIEVK